MLGPGMLEAINAAATVKGLIEKDEDFFHTADEIADEQAFEAGWYVDGEGTWRDAYSEEVDTPLDCLYRHNLPTSLQEAIVDACVEAFNRVERTEEDMPNEKQAYRLVASAHTRLATAEKALRSSEMTEDHKSVGAALRILEEILIDAAGTYPDLKEAP